MLWFSPQGDFDIEYGSSLDWGDNISGEKSLFLALYNN